MRKHFVYLSLASAFVFCCMSCNSNNADKNVNLDELGDTVPASEFAIVEDTAQASASGDTIVAPVKK